MDEQLRQLITDRAKKWILEAGELIRNKINEPIKIDTKANDNDLVTEIDKQTEKYFAEKIKDTFPNHLLLGEEGYGDNVKSLDGIVWIIDPIDGTMNFVHLKKDFAISIGIFHNGVGEIGFVFDVMGDVLYSACKGKGAFKNGVQLNPLSDKVKLKNSIFAFNHDLLCGSQQFNNNVIVNLIKDIRSARIIGAASLEMVNVAEGKFDGYISNGLSPWDVAGGFIILNEVGGITSRSNGEVINMLEKGTVISINKHIYKEALNKYFCKWKKE